MRYGVHKPASQPVLDFCREDIYGDLQNTEMRLTHGDKTKQAGTH